MPQTNPFVEFILHSLLSNGHYSYKGELYFIENRYSVDWNLWEYLKLSFLEMELIILQRVWLWLFGGGSKTIIGGGDTLSALKKAEVSELEVTHVSTGGGALNKIK